MVKDKQRTTKQGEQKRSPRTKQCRGQSNSRTFANEAVKQDEDWNLLHVTARTYKDKTRSKIVLHVHSTSRISKVKDKAN